jgi:hypothetical protein
LPSVPRSGNEPLANRATRGRAKIHSDLRPQYRELLEIAYGGLLHCCNLPNPSKQISRGGMNYTLAEARVRQRNASGCDPKRRRGVSFGVAPPGAKGHGVRHRRGRINRSAMARSWRPRGDTSSSSNVVKKSKRASVSQGSLTARAFRRISKACRWSIPVSEA